MALTKATQAYLSIASVFLLTIVGSGAYLLHSNTGPVSHADTKTIQSKAQLSLASSDYIYSAGETFSVNVEGQFSGEPVTSAQILLSYPNKLVQFVSVEDNSSLGLPELVSNDIATGTLSLTYRPLTGYTKPNAHIVSVTFKTLSPGQANITLETVSQLQKLKPTIISMVTKEIVPETKNITIVIK